MMRLSNRSGGSGDAVYSIDFAVGAFLPWHT